MLGNYFQQPRSAKPICKQCEQEGKTYCVYEHNSSTTLMGIPSPYWNEEGEYIIPKNPNTTKVTYSCSNGHYFSETY